MPSPAAGITAFKCSAPLGFIKPGIKPFTHPEEDKAVLAANVKIALQTSRSHGSNEPGESGALAPNPGS